MGRPLAGRRLLSVALIAGVLALPATVTSLDGPAEAGTGGAATFARQGTGTAGSGQIQERSFASAALGRTMPYLVYLPPGYDAELNEQYPVVYMLHGMGGSYTTWRDYGLLAAADRLIRAGEIPPLIIVLPEGESAYWVDHADGGPRWGSYVARDLVAEIDSRFRTVGHRHARAIGGLSMGGHGALQLALNHPGTFGVVGAHSFALRRHEHAPPYFGDRADFALRDPATLCARFPQVARGFRVWLDIGTEDPWQPAATAFHRQLDDAGIPHRWTIWSGGHTATYWSNHAEDYLRFYGEALGTGGTPAGPWLFLTPA